MTLNDYLTYNMGISDSDTIIIWENPYDYDYNTSNWTTFTVGEIPEKLKQRTIFGFIDSSIFKDHRIILA